MSERLAATFTAALLLVALTVVPRAALAHLMPDRQGTLNVVDNSVFAVLAVPVSALHGFDDDGDGALGAAELQAHKDALRAEVDRRLALHDGATLAETVRVDLVLSPQHGASESKADVVVALKHATFRAPPTDLRLACDLFAATGDRALTFTATRHPVGAEAQTEAAFLTPLSPEHRFFRATAATILDSIRGGVEHVLTGFDHLLFLLTIMVAGVGWRYWLGVTTTFTLAHSITLAASAFGVVHLAPAVVEPLIALSIVGVAADNLLRRGRARVRERLAVVFVCGLVHGMGFASSFGDLALDDAHRLYGLAGFNLGIELGQALFLCTALAALALARRLQPAVTLERSARWVSVVAGLLGGVWLVQRLTG
jgi:hypothetical protein